MSRTVIVTGGQGFVGRHLIYELEQDADTVIRSWDLPDIDITDPDMYEDRLLDMQPDWVVHLAAFADVGDSFKDPELVRRINVRGTETLLKTIKQKSSGTKVLVVSSADIYGPAGSAPIPELPLEKARPHSPYADSKLRMEKVIEERFDDFCIRVRPFPHIGPGQKLGFVTADFASQIARIEAGTQEPVICVGNLEAKRDFTDVRDVVKAYRLLLEKGEVGEVYNVASGRVVSIQDILDQLLELSSVHIDVKQDPKKMRPSDNLVLFGDANKLRNATGWKPLISLNKSLEDVLQYWRRQDTEVFR